MPDLDLPTSSASQSFPQATSQRVLAIDALRGLPLIAMGLICNRIQDFNWSDMRWMGVL